jgi:hypothetical protein
MGREEEADTTASAAEPSALPDRREEEEEAGVDIAITAMLSVTMAMTSVRFSSGTKLLRLHLLHPTRNARTS